MQTHFLGTSMGKSFWMPIAIDMSAYVNFPKMNSPLLAARVAFKSCRMLRTCSSLLSVTIPCVTS